MIGPVLLAAVLSLIGLTSRSLGFDEGATIAIVSQHGAALGRAIARDGGNMSGYYLLMHVLVGAFGDGPWVLRLPSVVFAALTPGFVAAIALALWRDRRVAVGRGGAVRGQPAARLLGADGARVRADDLPGVRGDAVVRALHRGGGGRAAVAGSRARVAGGDDRGRVLRLHRRAARARSADRTRARRRPPGAGARSARCSLALLVLCIPLLVLARRRGSGQLFWVPKPNHQVDTQVMQSLTGSGLQSTFHRVFITTPGWIATSVVLLGADRIRRAGG